VIAFNQEELQEVHKLYEQGIINGLDPKEMEIINRKELLKREPNVSKKALGALVCNSSIAIDPIELTKTLMANAIKNGVTLKVNAKVNKIKKIKDLFTIETVQGLKVKAKMIINVAGHYADEIAKIAKYPDFTTVTRRGQYRILEKDQTKLVNSILFMIPTIHGKGVIVAPTLDGHLMVGPTAENGVPKNDTRLITAEQ
jgi:glycerol-3-phosphate dehydrogenase